MAIRASPTWWDEKLEKIKKYSVLELDNELYRSTNNEQSERVVSNCDEFERRVFIAYFVHHSKTMIPFNKSDRSKTNALTNQDAQKNIEKEPTTLDFTMFPTKSSSSRSSLDRIFKGSIDKMSQLPIMSLCCFMFLETAVHSLEDASYFLDWLLELHRKTKWVHKDQSNPSEVKWELHSTNMIMLVIGSLKQHIITIFLDIINDTHYKSKQT
jgi:hypothetical protein